MDNLLQHYQYKFVYPSLVRGQGTVDEFVLDWRNTHSPNISNKGYIDFAFSGEVHKYGGAKDIFHKIIESDGQYQVERIVDINTDKKQTAATTNYCDIANDKI